MKLEGKVALVTGAGRNIGRAIALAMADNGASVAVNGLQNQEAINEVSKLIEVRGGKAVPILADVSDPTQVNRMVEKIASTLGPVDILVSNVGVRPHGPIHEVSVAEWRTVMSVNLDAAFYLSKAVLPAMIRAESGSLIAIAGLAAFGVRKDTVAVAAAKAGLIGLMRGIAFDYGKIGIRANVVSPGSINTDRYDQSAYVTGNPAKVVEDDPSRRQGIPMQRMGTPEEVAAACVFLSSADAGYTTGQTLHVGGGVYME
ncbi:MAG: SDR family NAD(P)-dependent oxidoreductase [Chloroflexota bacterium]|nr:SDR family NAD(P)-dependent oxidoreductase [Chloroflexota bacterium]